jgi:hypothetical protein
MKTKSLNENELKEKIFQIYKEEEIKIFEQKWNSLSSDDKKFVLEFLKVLHPEKSKLLNEAKWYNTVGDIAGIFDPTGTVDLINGISYWKQGDHLFALLSWISVIPYVGDVVAKPVIGVFKAGGIIGKEFKAAMVQHLRNAPDDIGQYAKENLNIIADDLAAGKWNVKPKNPGSMYEVNIDADPNAFLDWDKPLSEQPEVQSRLGIIGEAARSSTTKGVDKYISLENMLGDRAAVTEKLKEAGIPGIKYLDAGSRTPLQNDDLKYLANDLDRRITNAERDLKTLPDSAKAEYQSAIDGMKQERRAVQKKLEPTRNYVVFDDKLISIVKKYGIAGASAMLGYNLLEGINPAQADELKRIEAGK